MNDVTDMPPEIELRACLPFTNEESIFCVRVRFDVKSLTDDLKDFSIEIDVPKQLGSFDLSIIKARSQVAHLLTGLVKELEFANKRHMDSLNELRGDKQ